MTLRAQLTKLLAREFWLPWATGLLAVLLLTAVLMGIRRIAYRRLAKLAPTTATHFDDLLLGLVTRTSSLFLVAVSLLAALQVVVLPRVFERTVRAAGIVMTLFQAGVWVSWTLREVIERRFEALPSGGEDAARRTVARMITLAARVLLWALVVLVALSNFGVDITALVAGLGVGGVAVALATQNILGDVFASISILLDKPFVPGDFVVVEDYMGTVDHIGIKTTRVRSLGGEEIVFSNADLLRSRLRNYKRMTERRVVFRLGVVYQTSPETLAQIPSMLRAIIEAQQGTRFDRAHFASYGDFALQFEVVYFVLSPDYNRYMDLQQSINLAIARRFTAEGIDFAYPTQTLLLNRPSPRTSSAKAGPQGGKTAEQTDGRGVHGS
jgi:small-conductance mechanosensitive channel